MNTGVGSIIQPLTQSSKRKCGFIASNELPPLLKAAQTRGLRILWVAVSASGYAHTAIHFYQALNDPDRPLDTVSKPQRARAWVEIVSRILEQSSTPRGPGLQGDLGQVISAFPQPDSTIGWRKYAEDVIANYQGLPDAYYPYAKVQYSVALRCQVNNQYANPLIPTLMRGSKSGSGHFRPTLVLGEYGQGKT